MLIDALAKCWLIYEWNVDWCTSQMLTDTLVKYTDQLFLHDWCFKEQILIIILLVLDNCKNNSWYWCYLCYLICLQFVLEGMEESGSEGLDELVMSLKDTFLKVNFNIKIYSWIGKKTEGIKISETVHLFTL